MRLFQKSESVAARRDLFIQLIDSSTGGIVTGATLTVKIVKPGGSSYASIAGSSGEIGNGTYKISLAAADLDTVGQCMVYVTGMVGGQTVAYQWLPLQVVTLHTDAHHTKAALVNKSLRELDTGTDTVKDDDGVTTLFTISRSEAGGVVTRSTA